MRRRLLFVAFAWAGIVPACDDFATGTAPDAGVDGGATDGGPTDGGDAGPIGRADATSPDAEVEAEAGSSFHPVVGTVDSSGLYASCPPPTAHPSSDFSAVKIREMSLPPQSGESADYPWGVVTDATAVWWVSQVAKRTDDQQNSDAYNGVSDHGRVHRLDKTAENRAWKETLIVDADEKRATAIAIDGESVYWATVPSPNRIQMRRVPRSCTSGCAPANAGDAFNNVAPIVRMRRAADGYLFLLSDAGVIYTFHTPNNELSVGVFGGPNEGFAPRNDDVFVSTYQNATVGRFERSASTTTTTYTTFPPVPVDGGDPGAALLATDCQSLFAHRSGKTVWKSDITAPGFAFFAPSDATDVYELGADAYWIYIGSANGFGFRAVSIETGQAFPLLTGSYWRIAIDDSGVYAGEHSKVKDLLTGAMRRVK